ncbi:MAG: glycosyltransferase family 4 protein [Nitrospirota bacterium]
MAHQKPIRLLVVAHWPLGGIRTYMKYVYKYLPDRPERYAITILASSTPEDGALKRDAEEVGARLITYDPHGGKGHPSRIIFREMLRNSYDLIQSQGFISSLHVYPANLFFRVPHILTVHGILEERFLKGTTAPLKRAALSWVIRHVDALYAVSNDIMEHLYDNVPSLRTARCRRVVIKNGIDVQSFTSARTGNGDFRKKLGAGREVFLIGFLGRFMQQKGFDYLIDAVEELERSRARTREFKVAAVGSGDYLEWYKRVVRERRLEHRFAFIPFQSDVLALYRDFDVVAMPSIWEASGLLAMEALCAGTPLIASDCIGLRETVRDTPALVFESRNAAALAQALHNLMAVSHSEQFDTFRSRAVEQFDVRKTAREVDRLFTALSARRL